MSTTELYRLAALSFCFFGIARQNYAEPSVGEAGDRVQVVWSCFILTKKKEEFFTMSVWFETYNYQYLFEPLLFLKIMSYNGGAVVAMTGKNCVAIARLI